MEFLKSIKVKNIIFQSNDSAYVIFEGTLGRDLFTFKGTCPDISIGDLLDGEGVLKKDHYGEHFQMSYLVVHIPSETSEIANYLKSLQVKGLGERTCLKIAEKYGSTLFNYVEEDAPELIEIKGVSSEKISLLFEELKETVRVRSLQMFVVNLGLGMKLATKLTEYYGDDAEKLVRQNPYRLMFDIEGIGFERADTVGTTLGFKSDSEQRIKALIFHVLNEVGKSTGSTKIQFKDFYFNLVDKLGTLVSPQKILDVIWQLNAKGVVYLFQNDAVNYISTTVDYMNEKGVAKHVWRLTDDLSAVAEIDVEQYLSDQHQKGNKIQPTPSQLLALKGIVNNNLSLLIGAPGRGKTFTVKIVIDILIKYGVINKDKVGLAAPTGIASKILEEATGFPASTVHRLLKYLPETGDFEYNEYERMEELDLLLVDESSMLDAYMSNCCLRAVANKTRVVLLGDKNQLSSVDKGSVLRDLIKFGGVPTYELVEGKRFSEDSDISICAEDINSGNPPSVVNKSGGNFFFKKAFSQHQIKQELLSYIVKAQQQFGLELDDIQVLTPMVVGTLGSDALSLMIKTSLNPTPKNESVVYKEKMFGLNDRVILRQNMYDKGVYNGDIGKVISVISNQKIVVEFSKEIAEFSGAELSQVDLAYAVSVHKAQGSQFPVVIMPFHSTYGLMLYRSLAYTGITRTKLKFIGIGDFSSLAYAAKNDISEHRETTLLGHLNQANLRISELQTLVNDLGL